MSICLSALSRHSTSLNGRTSRSYGILLWEIYSGGHMPYPAFTNAETRTEIRKG